MKDYVSEITWLFGPSDSVFSHLNTEIEGRFGILEPIRWPLWYSRSDSVFLRTAHTICSLNIPNNF